MESKVYNQEGKEVGAVTLPEKVFNAPWNADLVHQVTYSMLSNARGPVAHTKDRGAVRGGGKKPWQQKGTGRARHGSIRSPLWRKGGVTHGPLKEKNYERKINKKMKTKALCVVISRKMRDGEVLFINELNLSEKKTARAKDILGKLSTVKGFNSLFSKRNNAAYITVTEANPNIKKSFSNLSNVSLDEFRNINPVKLLNYKYLVMANPEDSVKFIEHKLTR
ncbi:50S ribosomal protein L4 [Candidatus Parcubacteria bacterium]|nr:50S ribosomal protein L4 [Candidatus Parcubacteria bacterium]